VSVIIATYNRAASVAVLLEQLAAQTLPPERFDVWVVDDGSKVPVAPTLLAWHAPYALHVLTQPNAGQATARHNAIARARGELLVVVDDDMRVGPTFLAEHLAAHAAGVRQVVLGSIRPEESDGLPLFERCHLALAKKLEDNVRAKRAVLRGTHLYTGNVSMHRADYLAVGGFDPAFRISEDAELGVRLDLAGAEFRFSEAAMAQHASDHTSLATWMRRSASYGGADSLVSEKHAALDWANPWRFLFLMHAGSRPLLLTGALLPRLMQPVSWLAMYVALACARLGAERVAIAGTTFVYGLQYFIGVRRHAGGLRRALRGLRRYRQGKGLSAA
jgi:glycosyltransferase involved in cell wall biosynthesis